jgi:hypothetical protein
VGRDDRPLLTILNQTGHDRPELAGPVLAQVRGIRRNRLDGDGLGSHLLAYLFEDCLRGVQSTGPGSLHPHVAVDRNVRLRHRYNVECRARWLIWDFLYVFLEVRNPHNRYNTLGCPFSRHERKGLIIEVRPAKPKISWRR